MIFFFYVWIASTPILAEFTPTQEIDTRQAAFVFH